MSNEHAPDWTLLRKMMGIDNTLIAQAIAKEQVRQARERARLRWLFLGEGA
jgi:hypothetical protein